MQHRSAGLVYAQLNALLAGLAFATGDCVVDVISGVRYAALAYLIAAPVNTILWSLTHAGVLPKLHAEGTGGASAKMPAGAWLWLIVHSLCSVGGIAFLWSGMALVDAAIGSLLSRLELVVAVVLGLFWLGERFSRLQWLGLALTVAGVIYMRWTVLAGEPLGFIYLLSAALMFGLAEVTGKVALQTIPVHRLVLIRAWLMLLVLGAITLTFEHHWTPLTPALWGWLIASALLGPVLSRNSYMLALSFLPVSLVVLLNQTQPVYAAAAAFLIKGDVPAPQTYAGGLAILLGIAVLAWGQLNRRAADQPASTGASP